jgi:hypothetical protein
VRAGVYANSGGIQPQRRHHGTARSDRLQKFPPPKYSLFAVIFHRRLSLPGFPITSLEGRNLF